MPLVLCSVPMLGLVDFLCVAFEVCIDNEWHRELPLSVLEQNFLLLQLLWKLDSLSLLLVAELNVFFQSFLSCKAMKTVETEVLSPTMLCTVSH